MSNEIGLQDLIYQVKRELLARNQAERARDPDPLFFIDKVDLEITIKIQKEGSGGINLSVLSFAELSAGGAVTSERGHVVKVSLSPLLAKEDILETLLDDPEVRKRIEAKLRQATVKSASQLAGTPE